jgi:hypothetical protein
LNEALLFIGLGSVAFLFGVRGSVRLTRRYLDVKTLLVGRERMLLGSLVLVAWIITTAAGYFDVISIVRLLGYTLPPGMPIVSILVASVVLFIPSGLDYVVNRVASVPWQP